MSEKDKISIGKKTYFLSIISVAVVVFVLSYGVFSLAGKNQSRQDDQMPMPSNSAPSEGEQLSQSPSNSADSTEKIQQDTLTEKNNISQPPAQTNAGDTSVADSYIGEDAAKEAALADAGVKESDTAYMSCYVDYDDGRAEHYNVEFVVGSTEYEYEIDLYSGSVLEKSMDAVSGIRPDNRTPETSDATASYIGEEAAWTTALNHAGLKETEVSKKKVELDMEDGIMVYEVEFEKGRTEYDYEINAVSGEIIKAEKDID